MFSNRSRVCVVSHECSCAHASPAQGEEFATCSPIAWWGWKSPVHQCQAASEWPSVLSRGQCFLHNCLSRRDADLWLSGLPFLPQLIPNLANGEALQPSFVPLHTFRPSSASVVPRSALSLGQPRAFTSLSASLLPCSLLPSQWWHARSLPLLSVLAR